MKNGVRLQAHKGVECEFPENTMPSFIAAAEQGYEMIELDLGVTADEKIVVLHDEAINRTARNPDGSKIKAEINIGDLTYEEALKYDFGISFSKKFAGTKIPLFEDVIKLAEKNDITLKIDNKIRKFTERQLSLLFDMLRSSSVKVLISCWSRESALLVRRELPLAGISFDGLVDEEELKTLSAIAGENNFYDWIPLDYSRAKWVPAEWWKAKELVDMIGKYAKVCIWAIKNEKTFDEFCSRYTPYAAETDGSIKPDGFKK